MEVTQNVVNKLSHALTYHYSIFHADLLERAILDEEIDDLDFQAGFEDLELHLSNPDKYGDCDEYVPEIFKNA